MPHPCRPGERIAGILDSSFRWEPAYTAAAEMFTIAAFGILTALLLPILSPLISTLVTGIIIAGALAFNYYMWTFELHVLPLAMTLYTLFAIYIINMMFGYLFETRSRQHMDSLFGQYVPPDLVKAMSRDPEHYSLASEKRELSVLFTDIRGFTSISEGLDAGELSELMDEYLTPMTRIVHETQGTIDKYIGDAVMAFWGAPLFHPNHAEQAVGAGLAMLKALDAQAPVVFVSGYWDRDLERRLRDMGALGFVQKPYEAATLRDAIVQAMTAHTS